MSDALRNNTSITSIDLEVRVDSSFSSYDTLVDCRCSENPRHIGSFMDAVVRRRTTLAMKERSTLATLCDTTRPLPQSTSEYVMLPADR